MVSGIVNSNKSDWFVKEEVVSLLFEVSFSFCPQEINKIDSKIKYKMFLTGYFLIAHNGLVYET